MSGHCRRVRVPPHGSANGAGASPHRRSYNSVGGHGADRDPLGGLVHSTREGSGRVFRFVSHLVQTVCELESSRVKLSRRLSVEEYGIMRCDTYSLCILEIVLVCCCCCLIGLRDPASLAIYECSLVSTIPPRFCIVLLARVLVVCIQLS